MTQAYPLQWPEGWPRTRVPQDSKFEVTMAKAQSELISEIARLAGKSIVVSTNLPVRNDGLPYAGGRIPGALKGDAGVAVYFVWRGKQVVFACDRYKQVGDNVRAIGLTLGALRGIERWGATGALERAFTGFTALPPADIVHATYEES